MGSQQSISIVENILLIVFLPHQEKKRRSKHLGDWFGRGDYMGDFVGEAQGWMGKWMVEATRVVEMVRGMY